MPVVSRTMMLENRLGLHARPSALIVKTLQGYQCQMQVKCGGEVANARSILGLLSLAAGYGAKLTFVASGPDAESALNAIEKLFTSNFRDAYP